MQVFIFGWYVHSSCKTANVVTDVPVERIKRDIQTSFTLALIVSIQVPCFPSQTMLVLNWDGTVVSTTKWLVVL